MFVGTGGSGQMAGVFSLAGTSTVIATGATAFSTFWSKLADLRLTHRTTWGEAPDLLVAHPRRQEWATVAGTVTGFPFTWGVERSVLSNRMPTNRWTGSTCDAVIALSSSGIALRTSPASITVLTDYSSAGGLTARIVGDVFAGLHARNPLAISHLGGTLSTPSF